MTPASGDVLDLSSRVAVVTGASRGIGRAIAATFAARGARVVLSSRKEDGLRDAAATIDGDVSWFAANAGEEADARACIDHAMETYGAVDILVNNAATNPYFGPLVGLDVARASKTVLVNQIGPIHWTRCAVEAHMLEHGGCVINIASIGGFQVEPDIGFYNATKAALIHLTRQLANELSPAIRVNAVAPGLVRTDMARAIWGADEASAAARIPLGRLGEVEDIANAALFLASEASSWITGHTLTVDGGIMVRDHRSMGD